mmetsp:Transcript_19674/g.53087  ORF Transcript_19674/g.53087 Transcript_19674/m.53087 type:complete len:133 (+) Transcript_19674:134-532(+)
MLATVLLALHGFVLVPTQTRPAVSRVAVRMDAMQDQLVQLGEQCLESGCSVDETTELVARLNSRRVQLQKELTWVLVTLGKLQALSEQSQAKKPDSELQKVVADAVSIFKVPNNDYPELPEPVGYSMDRPKK